MIITMLLIFAAGVVVVLALLGVNAIENRRDDRAKREADEDRERDKWIAALGTAPRELSPFPGPRAEAAHKHAPAQRFHQASPALSTAPLPSSSLEDADYTPAGGAGPGTAAAAASAAPPAPPPPLPDPAYAAANPLAYPLAWLESDTFVAGLNAIRDHAEMEDAPWEWRAEVVGAP